MSIRYSLLSRKLASDNLNDTSDALQRMPNSPRKSLVSVYQNDNEPRIYKFKDFWQRAMFKIKVNNTLEKFRNELMVYGTSNHILDLNDQFRANLSQIFDKKINFKLTFTQLIHQKIKTGCVLTSKSTFLSIWNSILTVIVFYISLFMPVRIAFYENNYWDIWTIIETFIDIFFMVDVIVNCLTSYMNKNEKEVTDLKSIMIHYSQTWLILDLIASIPLGIINYELGIESNKKSITRYNKLFRLSKLPRLYRLFAIFRILKALKSSQNSTFLAKIVSFLEINARILKFLKFLGATFLFVHNFGCFWYFTAVIDNFSPETWVVRFDYLDTPVSSLYITSLYWAITTMTTVGYGDICARTDSEKILSMLMMICGVGFYSYTISSLGSFLSNIDTRDSILTEKMAAINEFVKDSHVGDELKNKIRQAIKFRTNKLGSVWSDKNSLFNELPKSLRYEVALSMYGGIAKYHPFFRGKDSAYIVLVIPCLAPLIMNEDEFVYQIGDYADSVYLIAEGRVSLVTEMENITYKSYLKGSYFGEIEIFSTCIREESVITTFESEFFLIHKIDYLRILEEFPVEKNNAIKIAVEKLKKNEKCKKEILDLVKLWMLQGNVDQLGGRNISALKKMVETPKKTLKIVKEILDEKVNKSQSAVAVNDKIDNIEKNIQLIFNKISKLDKQLSQNFSQVHNLSL